MRAGQAVSRDRTPRGLAVTIGCCLSGCGPAPSKQQACQHRSSNAETDSEDDDPVLEQRQ